MKWQYKTISLIPPKGLFSKQPDTKEIDEKLRPLGEDGWELVSIYFNADTSGAGTTFATLKKQMI